MSDRGYPIELRERVVAALKHMSHEKAAEVFSVGSATVYRWSRLYKETGGVDPRPHGGGQARALTDGEDQLVKRLVNEKPDRTIAELTFETCKQISRTVSTSAIVRSLKRLGISLKKKSSRPSRRTGRTSKGATRRSSKR